MNSFQISKQKFINTLGYKKLSQQGLNLFSGIKSAPKLAAKLAACMFFPMWYNEKFNKKLSFLKPEEWKALFEFGKSSIPHYKKRAKGGEDASFESKNLLVVADGVGGWNEMGIDPAAYSKNLVELIVHNFSKYEKERLLSKDKPINVNENLVKFMIVKSVKLNRELGSSTVSVLYLDQVNNMLYSGYLGDSCYLIARPKGIGEFEILFKAEEHTHGFNIPYQVGKEGDDPNQAIINKHKVEKNDLIILATDGLWDNLEVQDILKEINRISKEKQTVTLNTKALAKRLSTVAEQLSLNPDHFSPFARRAYEQNYKKFCGGKPDDITIIIAQVNGESLEEERFGVKGKSGSSDDTRSFCDMSDTDCESTKD